MLIYSGMGGGIALSGVLSPVLVKYFNAWVGLALICFPLSLICWIVLIPWAEESKTELHSNGTIKFEKHTMIKIQRGYDAVR